MTSTWTSIAHLHYHFNFKMLGATTMHGHEHSIPNPEGITYEMVYSHLPETHRHLVIIHRHYHYQSTLIQNQTPKDLDFDFQDWGYQMYLETSQPEKEGHTNTHYNSSPADNFIPYGPFQTSINGLSQYQDPIEKFHQTYQLYQGLITDGADDTLLLSFYHQYLTKIPSLATVLERYPAYHTDIDFQTLFNKQVPSFKVTMSIDKPRLVTKQTTPTIPNPTIPIHTKVERPTLVIKDDPEECIDPCRDWPADYSKLSLKQPILRRSSNIPISSSSYQPPSPMTPSKKNTSLSDTGITHLPSEVSERETTHRWKVKSNNNNNNYLVSYRLDDTYTWVGDYDCNCPGFKYHGKCSHIDRVKQYVEMYNIDINSYNNLLSEQSESEMESQTSKSETSDLYSSSDSHSSSDSEMDEKKETWTIASGSDKNKTYTVTYQDNQYSCECLGFKYKGHCSHIDHVIAHYSKNLL